MKFISIVLLISAFFIAKANPVKPYLAIVHTPAGKIKGVLYYIDSTGIVIDPKDGMMKIKATDIKDIKIREFKKKYQVKKFLKYDPWDESNYERTTSGQKVRKNNEKEPTLTEELGGHAGATFINGVLNLLVAPFHAINPAIYTSKKFVIKDEVSNLSGYCIFYQHYPDMLKLAPLKP
jgi:hypothetical protein